jgi:hypothetical protein
VCAAVLCVRLVWEREMKGSSRFSKLGVSLCLPHPHTCSLFPYVSFRSPLQVLTWLVCWVWRPSAQQQHCC